MQTITNSVDTHEAPAEPHNNQLLPSATAAATGLRSCEPLAQPNRWDPERDPEKNAGPSPVDRQVPLRPCLPAVRLAVACRRLPLPCLALQRHLPCRDTVRRIAWPSARAAVQAGLTPAGPGSLLVMIHIPLFMSRPRARSSSEKRVAQTKRLTDGLGNLATLTLFSVPTLANPTLGHAVNRSITLLLPSASAVRTGIHLLPTLSHSDVVYLCDPCRRCLSCSCWLQGHQQIGHLKPQP